MSDSESTEQPIATILPREDRSPRPFLVQGVLLGVSPHGVVIHFFADYPSLPANWIVAADGSETFIDHEQKTVRREILSTVILPPDVALRMASGLPQAVSAMEEAAVVDKEE